MKTMQKYDHLGDNSALWATNFGHSAGPAVAGESHTTKNAQNYYSYDCRNQVSQNANKPHHLHTVLGIGVCKEDGEKLITHQAY